MVHSVWGVYKYKMYIININVIFKKYLHVEHLYLALCVCVCVCVSVPHLPANPQAGFTSRKHFEVCRGHIWTGLQGLHHTRRLTEGTRTHNVHLLHSEPERNI